MSYLGSFLGLFVTALAACCGTFLGIMSIEHLGWFSIITIPLIVGLIGVVVEWAAETFV